MDVHEQTFHVRLILSWDGPQCSGAAHGQGMRTSIYASYLSDVGTNELLVRLVHVAQLRMSNS